MKKRNIFIGDIHGCFDEFKLLIEKLSINKEDCIFLVGDMINKGPKSWKVIKYLYNNQKQFSAVLGNHEIAFLQRINSKEKKYESKDFIELESKFVKYPEIFNYFKNLPLFIEKKDFIVIHGGLKPGKKLEEHSETEITTIREINNEPWYIHYTGSKKIIYGHWAMNGLNIYDKTIGLDGGCVYGRSLHSYTLETGEIMTQQALKLHKDVFIKED